MNRAAALFALLLPVLASGQDAPGGDFAASKGVGLEEQLNARLKAAVRTIPGSDTEFLVGGYVQVDAIAGRKQQDGDEQDTFFVSATPFTSADPVRRLSVRQSQLNWVSRTPTGRGELWTRMEANLFPLDGTTAPTLNQLFVRLDDRVLVGKTYSTFMDDGVLPTTLDYNGPGGVVFVRQMQARVSFPIAAGWSVQGAVEDAQADLSGGNAFIGVTSDARRPDLVARVRFEAERGHVQLAGLSRSVDVAATTLFGQRERHVSGTGVAVSGAIATVGDDTLLWQVAGGKGIGRYFNDPLSTAAIGVDANRQLEALRNTGATLYYQRKWTPDWMTVVGGSTLWIDADGALRAPDDLKRIVYLSANLVHRFTPTLLGGVEAMWGEATRVDNASATNARLQFSVRYLFF